MELLVPNTFIDVPLPLALTPLELNPPAPAPRAPHSEPSKGDDHTACPLPAPPVELENGDNPKPPPPKIAEKGDAARLPVAALGAAAGESCVLALAIEGCPPADSTAKGLKGLPPEGREVSPGAPMALEPENPNAGAALPAAAALAGWCSPAPAAAPNPKAGGVWVAAGCTPNGEFTKPAGADEADAGTKGFPPADAVGEPPKGFVV